MLYSLRLVILLMCASSGFINSCCWSSAEKKHLLPKYTSNHEPDYNRMQALPLHTREVIFSNLAAIEQNALSLEDNNGMISANKYRKDMFERMFKTVNSANNSIEQKYNSLCNTKGKSFAHGYASGEYNKLTVKVALFNLQKNSCCTIQ